MFARFVNSGGMAPDKSLSLKYLFLKKKKKKKKMVQKMETFSK